VCLKPSFSKPSAQKLSFKGVKDMKITTTQYAKSLYEATKEKSQLEIDSVVANFFKLLQKNGQMKLAKKTIEKFLDIYNKDQGIVEAEITSREVLSNELLNKIKTYIINKYSAKEVGIKNIIDEKIKGGIILQVGDEMMDASVRKQLIELKKNLVA